MPDRSRPASAVVGPGLPAAQDIEVWTTVLTTSEPSSSPRRLTVLSPDEQGRADRFHFPKDRDAFVAGRIWLRTVLAGYLGLQPEELRFGYRRDGKPYLPAAPDLGFNLAHSGGLAVLAVARDREIGIDVEAVRPVREKVAERFFAPGEVAELRALSPSDQLFGFFNAWTRKEAYLKALGSGLAAPLDGFEVSLAPGAEPKLLSVRGDPDEAARWRLAALDLPAGFVGALASKPAEWSVRLKDADRMAGDR